MLGEPVTEESLRLQDMAYFTEQDRLILGEVERALSNGVALKHWWEQKDATKSYAEQFELVRTFNHPDRGTGFFDIAPLEGRTLSVMGVVEDICYDQLKGAPRNRVREELREFLMRYFMRVSDFRQPEAYVPEDQQTPPSSLREFSWCPTRDINRMGFGYSQHYYKLRGSGQVGKFPASEEFAIVDLRELGEKYEWIVAKVSIFDFNLSFSLGGTGSPQLVFPLKEENYLVISRDFITCKDEQGKGLPGEFGFGYSLIDYSTDRSIFSYGPGRFEAGFQLFRFRMLEEGAIRVQLVFVANRPGQITSVDISPVEWSFRLADLFSLGSASQIFAPVKNALEQLPLRLNGFDPVLAYISLANLLTGGQAAQDLCISKERLEKDFLIKHFMQHYQMIVGTLLVWRQVPDWLDTAALPEWIITGRSS